MASLPIGNIYAPPFMAVSPQIAGYEDIEFDLAFPSPNGSFLSVPNAGFLPNQQLLLDSDYDYLVREMWFVVQPVTGANFQPSDLRVRIRDADERLLTSDYIQAQNLSGVLPMIWGLKRGGVLTLDFQNVNATTAIPVQVVLKGWKRKACPGQVALPGNYVPMYKRYALPVNKGIELEDFEYPFTLTSAGAQDLLKLPLQTNNDADFLWRGISGDWNTANNAVATVGSIAVTFYDPTGVPLSLYPLINPWGSMLAGQFRELVFANGGGAPAPHYPEIEIKRGGIIQMDISFGGAGTLRFSLRGLKVHTSEACA